MTEEHYNRDPDGLAFCPYRISPLGAHIDHQFGKINGLALDKGIHIAYAAKHNGVVELKSLNFPKRAQFHVASIPEEKVGDWADHMRGAAKMLEEKYPLRMGLSAVIEGTLPVGGLSSSAAVIIAFLLALAKVNNITLGDWETTVVDDGTSTNETRLGAVKDIQYAVEKLGIDEDVLVLAGDNVLDFSLVPFVRYGQENGCSCIMCYEENELAKQQRTAIITVNEENTITSYEEKPKAPKSNLTVPPFYYYLAPDVKRIPEALEAGCGYDAPGSFAAWLSGQTTMKAYRMPGSRYDIGNLESYEKIKASYKGVVK